MYFIIVAFFAVRANVMIISWRVQMSELNWYFSRGLTPTAPLSQHLKLCHTLDKQVYETNIGEWETTFELLYFQQWIAWESPYWKCF